jgi:hypothetical protein
LSDIDVQEIRELQREVAELKLAIRDLVEAWRTAQGVVRLVKWMGGTAVSITAVWVLIKMAMGMKT